MKNSSALNKGLRVRTLSMHRKANGGHGGRGGVAGQPC